MPTVWALQRQALGYLQAGKLGNAEKVLRQIVKRYPTRPVGHYLLAVLLSRKGDTATSLDHLAAAIENGLVGADRLGQDGNLAALRSNPRFKQLMTRAGEVAASGAKPNSTDASPALIVRNKALVGEANTAWDPRAAALRAFFRHKSKLPATRVVHGGKDEVAKLLNRLYGQRQAAGNHGDLYDNRDGNHSALNSPLIKWLFSALTPR